MASYRMFDFDDEDEIEFLLLEELNSLPRDYGSVPKSEGYCNIILQEMSDQDFIKCVRLSRRSFYELVNFVTLHTEGSNVGKPQTPIVHQVIIFLHYLGSEETLIQMGKRFGLSHSTIQVIVRRILDILIPTFSAQEIKWPTAERQTAIKNQFLEKSGFPDVIGAIDCRENPILPPKDNPTSYYNRKSYYSIKLQAVADSEYKFIDVFVGWPGKSHDSRCFSNSPLFAKLENEDMNIGNSVILGDSAYPLKTYLMTPFKNTSPATQKSRYNIALSKARQVSFFLTDTHEALQFRNL